MSSPTRDPLTGREKQDLKRLALGVRDNLNDGTLSYYWPEHLAAARADLADRIMVIAYHRHRLVDGRRVESDHELYMRQSGRVGSRHLLV
jgi:hypothetical protein